MTPRCGAKNRAGKPCQQWPLHGATRCKFHGGASPRGIASASFKTGEYSKAMPQDLQKRFRAMAADSELLNLLRDVALVDARTIELFGELERPGASWPSLVAARARFEDARRRQDTQAMGVALNELLLSMDRGTAEREVWQRIFETVEARRKLIDSIHKHEVQHAELLTLAQAQVLFTGLARLVRQAFVGAMSQLTEKDEAIRLILKKALADVSEGFVALSNSGGGMVN